MKTDNYSLLKQMLNVERLNKTRYRVKNVITPTHVYLMPGRFDDKELQDLLIRPASLN